MIKENLKNIEKIAQKRISIVDAFYFCSSIAKLQKFREKLNEDLEKALEIVCKAIYHDFVRNETHKKATLY